MLNNRRELQADVLDEPVRSLLAAAAAPTEPGPLPGEAEALAAFRASQTTTRRSPVLTYLTAFRTPIAAALGTGVLLTTGMGVAMAGSLPGAAQDTASELLGKVGVTVPGADEHSAGHADQRGGSEDAADEPTSSEKDGKGSDVSELATTTNKTGVEKGAEVSRLASDGKSQAGEHGKAAEEHGKAGEHGKVGEHGEGEEPSASVRDDAARPEPTKPAETTEKAHVETPDDGEKAAADSAREGDSTSTQGTDKAGEAGAGRSAEGSTSRP